MARLLDPLRKKLIKAVQTAAIDMQGAMDYQLEYAMLYYPWKWKGLVEEDERVGFPYSNSGGNGQQGDLVKSKKASTVTLSRTESSSSIRFSFTWDPVFEESGRHYAALVHDGSSKPVEYQMWYLVDDMEPAVGDYSARPWTAWVVPHDQRRKMKVDFDIVQPSDVPDIGWQFAKEAFIRKLKSSLNGSPIRVSL